MDQAALSSPPKNFHDPVPHVNKLKAWKIERISAISESGPYPS
jgi:hypothetical protein